MLRALVDAGCTDSMMSGVVRGEGQPSVVVAFDGRRVPCKGRAVVNLGVGQTRLDFNVLVVEDMIDGIDLVENS